MTTCVSEPAAARAAGREGSAEHGAKDVRSVREVRGPRAPADALGGHLRPARRAARVSGDDCGARRGDELEVDPAVVGRQTTQALDRRGGGEREDSMARLHEASPHRQRRDDDLGAEPVDRGGAADDVDEGVDRADLVEVDVVDRGAVNLRLGLGEAPERRVRELFHPRRERATRRGACGRRRTCARAAPSRGERRASRRRCRSSRTCRSGDGSR